MANSVNNTEISAISAGAVIIALLFLFVWPGPLRYQYRVGPIAGNTTAVIRIDRLNGKTSILSGSEYKPLKAVDYPKVEGDKAR